jgi:hypothetical protein
MRLRQRRPRGDTRHSRAVRDVRPRTVSLCRGDSGPQPLPLLVVHRGEAAQKSCSPTIDPATTLKDSGACEIREKQASWLHRTRRYQVSNHNPGTRRSAGTVMPFDLVRNRMRAPSPAAMTADIEAADRREGRTVACIFRGTYGSYARRFKQKMLDLTSDALVRRPRPENRPSPVHHLRNPSPAGPLACH